MNKSIVLVMCDVLVLSSMSLSTGGFEQVDSAGLSSDHSISIEEYTNLVHAANALSVAQKEIKDAKKVADKAKQEAEGAKKDVDKAKQDADKAKQEANDAKKEADKAKHEADKAKRDAESAKHEAEDAKKIADKAKQEAEGAKKDVDKAKQEADKAKQEANDAKKEADKVKQEADKAKRDAESAKQAADKAKHEAEDAKKEVERIKAYYDDRYGSGVKRRQELINNDVYGVFIKYKKDDNQLLYSPIIQIGAEKFVIAYFERKLIKYISSIEILKDSRSFASVDSIYGINQHEELLFLRLRSCDLLENDVLSIGADSAQNDNLSSDDRYYWFRTKTGEVKKVGRSETDLIECCKASMDIATGDLMISENLARIVRIAVPKTFIGGELFKGDLLLKDIKKDDLKHLRHLEIK